MEERNKENTSSCSNKGVIFTKQNPLYTKNGAQLLIESLKICTLTKIYLSQKFQSRTKFATTFPFKLSQSLLQIVIQSTSNSYKITHS